MQQEEALNEDCQLFFIIKHEFQGITLRFKSRFIATLCRYKKKKVSSCIMTLKSICIYY